MASEMANPSPAAEPPKRRACDECRLRKIACSKESDGCHRCRKEGIECVYSLQKPMGRPRKRRHLEEEPSPPRTAIASEVSPPTAPEASAASTAASATVARRRHEPPAKSTTAASYNDAAIDAFLSTDSTLDFLNQPDGSDLSYLDLLPDFYPDNTNIFGEDEPISHMPSLGQMPFDSFAFSSKPVSGTDLLGGINFDEPDPSTATMSKDIRDSLQRYMASQYSQPAALTESSPSAQSNYFDPQDTSPTAAAPMLKANPNTPCTCLPSLYYAIDSLTRLPSDISLAMRIARSASRIAHSVISCSHCYDVFSDDPTKPPPIQCFQNLMCFGALVPSACNAYAAILEMVDAETECAKKENRPIWFSFKEIGDVWSVVAEDANSECEIVRHYNNKYLEPEIWRTTIRAIMRVDVYGFDEVKSSPPSPSSQSGPPTHRGLKDVVTMLDEKNRKRHELIDLLVESGQMPANSPYLLFPRGKGVCPPEESNCIKVLETARLALSNLVIA